MQNMLKVFSFSQTMNKLAKYVVKVFLSFLHLMMLHLAIILPMTNKNLYYPYLLQMFQQTDLILD